jgi:SAM-dependent methyltransferase
VNDSAPSSSSASTWDQMAQRYDAERHADPVYGACIRQAVADLRPAGVVLDCGCGTGLATGLLLNAQFVYALDFSAASLQELERKFGGRVRTALGDVRSLPYPNAMFDCVLVANVLQHLVPADQPKACAEILRVLKPGGRYVVSVHHFSNAKRNAGWKKEGKPGGNADVDYIFRYTRSELAALLPDAKIRAMGFYGLPSAVQIPLARFAGGPLARLGHGHMISARGIAH